MDSVIEREVLQELGSHHGIHATDLHVNVTGGVVRLSGNVRSFAESAAAEQEAFGVGGVVDVINTLRVLAPGGTPKSDVEIARAVRHALVWNALVPDATIRSGVTDGVVRLCGIVEDPSEREEAERSVCHLIGVRKVHNLITVRTKGIGRDAKGDVQTAPARQTQAESQRIRVDAREGSGAVTCSDHCGAAREVAGAGGR